MLSSTYSSKLREKVQSMYSFKSFTSELFSHPLCHLLQVYRLIKIISSIILLLNTICGHCALPYPLRDRYKKHLSSNLIFRNKNLIEIVVFNEKTIQTLKTSLNRLRKLYLLPSPQVGALTSGQPLLVPNDTLATQISDMSTIKAITLMTTTSGVIFKTLHFLRNS